MPRLIYGLSVLFHWSMCLFLVPYCFDFCKFIMWVSSGIVMPPTLLIFLCIALALGGGVCFVAPHKFLNCFVYFCDKLRWNLNVDCVESIDGFW